MNIGWHRYIEIESNVSFSWPRHLLVFLVYHLWIYSCQLTPFVLCRHATTTNNLIVVRKIQVYIYIFILKTCIYDYFIIFIGDYLNYYDRRAFDIQVFIDTEQIWAVNVYNYRVYVHKLIDMDNWTAYIRWPAAL